MRRSEVFRTVNPVLSLKGDEAEADLLHWWNHRESNKLPVHSQQIHSFTVKVWKHGALHRSQDNHANYKKLFHYAQIMSW